jgi:hypothetical protein
MISLLMNSVCKLIVSGGGVVIAGVERVGFSFETIHRGNDSFKDAR